MDNFRTNDFHKDICNILHSNVPTNCKVDIARLCVEWLTWRWPPSRRARWPAAAGAAGRRAPAPGRARRASSPPAARAARSPACGTPRSSAARSPAGYATPRSGIYIIINYYILCTK